MTANLLKQHRAILPLLLGLDHEGYLFACDFEVDDGQITLLFQFGYEFANAHEGVLRLAR
jgi:hypothetical protein